MTIRASRIRVIGLVQGVGFRPFIHRIAFKHGLKGYVVNLGGSEVEIHVEGSEEGINRFLRSLREEKPPPARIEELLITPVNPLGLDSFVIKRSERKVTRRSAIPPDLGICEDCLREILDPGDRRYRYPWNSCAWCGPRYSMIYRVPYDRENTSMDRFPLCEECRREYRDLNNTRRYHAQGISCQKCGPSTILLDGRGRIVETRDPIGFAARLLMDGHILAIKGMGGYHIAGLASRRDVVERVRRIKDRPSQPLALMVRDCKIAERIAWVNEGLCRILRSPQRPILLVEGKSGGPVDPLVAPGVHWLGIMLPYTGLHALLLREVDDGFLIMTSGNRHGFPMCRTLDCLLDQVGGEVDYILEHNRVIAHRVDDSVARLTRGRLLLLRRSRGYAPYWIRVKAKLPESLALGAELQTAGGVAFEDKIVLTQFIGDLDNPAQLSELQEETEWFLEQYKLKPRYLVIDMHPGYSSRRLAPVLMEKYGVEILEVQHHCAHALSVIADRGLEPGKTYPAVTVDGAGYGLDSNIWGGESLIVEDGSCERVSHIRYFPLPGGDAATRNPIRTLIGILSTGMGEDEVVEVLGKLGRIPDIIGESTVRLVYKMAGSSPLTSSAGRVADALSALLGFSYKRTYEGEPAIVLESKLLASKVEPDRDREPFIKGGGLDAFGSVMFTIESLLEGGLMEGMKRAATVLYWIGYTLASAALSRVRDDLLFSGGAAVNDYIAMGVEDAASEYGVSVVYHENLPPGDGGIAAGQLMRLAYLER